MEGGIHPPKGASPWTPAIMESVFQISKVGRYVNVIIPPDFPSSKVKMEYERGKKGKEKNKGKEDKKALWYQNILPFQHTVCKIVRASCKIGLFRSIIPLFKMF